MAGRRSNRMQKSVVETVHANRQVSGKPHDPSSTSSNIPIDLLGLIFSKLNLKDNIRASAVCKTWLAVATSLREPINAPWLMSFPKSGDWYQFYDPSNRNMCYMEYPELHDSRICYAKEGWLLAFNPITRRVFFFQPYTRELIKLPRQYAALDNVAFSAAPTSSNCVIFSLKNLTPTLISISICRPGATVWTFLHFRTQPFVSSIWSKVVYCKGMFYCLSLNGILGLFDPEKQMWIISSIPPPACMEFFSVEYLRRGNYMVEYNSAIFVIQTFADACPFIYKLDEGEGVWRETGSLGGMTLFANSLSSTARSEVHGRMRNNIYFSKVNFYGKRCVTYSPESGRYYPRKQYYDWGEEDAFQTIWIDPPNRYCVRSSTMNFHFHC